MGAVEASHDSEEAALLLLMLEAVATDLVSPSA